MFYNNQIYNYTCHVKLCILEAETYNNQFSAEPGGQSSLHHQVGPPGEFTIVCS